MRQEIRTNNNLPQQKLIKAESAKKKAIIVGWICFPIGVIIGVVCLFYGYGYLVVEKWDLGFALLGVACFCGFLILIGLSSFIAALIIKEGLRKAIGWIVIVTGALLTIGCIIFFTTQYYIWGAALGVDILFILIFIFIVQSPFMGWRLTHTKKIIRPTPQLICPPNPGPFRM